MGKGRACPMWLSLTCLHICRWGRKWFLTLVPGSLERAPTCLYLLLLILGMSEQLPGSWFFVCNFLRDYGEIATSGSGTHAAAVGSRNFSPSYVEESFQGS